MQITNKEREIVVAFLQWNDSNGQFNNLSKRDVLKIFFNTVNEDFLMDQPDTNPLSYTFSQIKQIAKNKNLLFSTTIKLKMLLDFNCIDIYKRLIKMI